MLAPHLLTSLSRYAMFMSSVPRRTYTSHGPDFQAFIFSHFMPRPQDLLFGLSTSSLFPGFFVLPAPLGLHFSAHGIDPCFLFYNHASRLLFWFY